jgi:hypothetical protein
MSTNAHRTSCFRPRVELLESRVVLNATGWVETINNPYLSFIPGTTFYFQGLKGLDRSTSIVHVTNQTKQIAGVETTVVHDNGFINGKLTEITTDWYAQDTAGNVWYFGEATAEILPNGTISHAGSWQAGVDGAQPGIVMQAHPDVGDTYRQEFAKGVAQDMASIISLKEQVAVPFGSFHNCLQTVEFSPLEPGVKETKYYKRGVGFLESFTIQGPAELLQLVRITHDSSSGRSALGPVNVESPGTSASGLALAFAGEQSSSRLISPTGASQDVTATGAGSASSAQDLADPVHAFSDVVPAPDLATLSVVNRQGSDEWFAGGLPFDDHDLFSTGM